MAAQQALTSPFQAGPGKLAKPAGSAPEAPELQVNPFAEFGDQAESEQDIAAETQEAEQGGQLVANPFIEAGAGGAVPPEDTRTPEEQAVIDQEVQSAPVNPEMGFFEQNFTLKGLRQQLDQMPDRIRKNLAEDPKTIENTFVARYGRDNVRGEGKGIEVRTPESAPNFIKVEADQFQIVNDLFSDFYRENIELMMGGTLAVPGAASPLPGGGPAGFVAGVAAGDLFSDAVGERFFGVKLDQSRSGAVTRTSDALQKGMWFAVFNNLAQRGSKVAAKKFDEIMKVRKIAKEVPETAGDIAQKNIETAELLKREGFIQNIPGTDVTIPAHQLLPHIAETKMARDSLSGTAAVAMSAVERNVAKNVAATSIDIAETALGITKGTFQGALAQGSTRLNANLSGKVKGVADSIIKMEGKIIGRFRKQAAKISGKNPLPMGETDAVLRKVIFKELGFRQKKDGGFIIPSDESLAGLLGTESTVLINGLKKDIFSLMQAADRGGLSVNELLHQASIIGGKNKAAGKVGGLYKSIIGRLSSAIRKDSREGIAIALKSDSTQAKAYLGSMKRIHSYSKAAGKMHKLLDDDLSSSYFVQHVISKGKNGLAYIKAAKELVGKQDPVLWNKVKSQWFEELALKHRSKSGATVNFNVEAMRKEISGLGTEFTSELFGSPAAAQKVLNVLDLSSQLKEMVHKGAPPSQLKEITRKVVTQLVSPFANANMNAIYAISQLAAGNGTMLKLLSREGVHEFTSGIKEPVKRESMNKMLNAILAVSRAAGRLGSREGAIAARGVGIEAAGATGRAVGDVAQQFTDDLSGQTQIPGQ